ncbi:hypothetical protein SAMN05421786_103328 [Chryseobacterium ureilyticum]|uniref:Uncharacterized protein n=1 Tax=Chryseobacterium ureilyticum TaxID=373668 RepID=A0A1N7N9K9_9FLAO|nr:hypothetical protein SAMN05421786_103328 [Chryseobacterium ureilyticum]
MKNKIKKLKIKHLSELKDKTFNGVYRIALLEDETQYILEDSIILKGEETFQILTTQQSLEVLKIEDEFKIDGEYESPHITLIPAIEETIYISNILQFYDKHINEISAFSIESKHLNYFFIRMSDEIQIIQKNEFEKIIMKLEA